MLKRLRIVLLALVAFAAAVAPTASSARPASDSVALDLGIYDEATTAACGGEPVSATVSGVYERHLYVKNDGSIDRQVDTFHGRITWYRDDSAKTYSSTISTKIVIEFPNGAELFNPVRITVTGTNGGVFPIFKGPAGSGQLVYNGFMWSQDDSGLVFWANEGEPISQSGDFGQATQRICAALA